MTFKKYLLTILVLVIGFTAFTTYGNGFGIKLDQAVGEYIVNVDADTYNFVSGEPVNFVFMLWNQDRTERLEFDNAWVSITPAGSFGNIFGGFLGEPDFGGFRLTTVFPKAGNYTMVVRYGKMGEKFTDTIAEATFPITVTKGSGEGFGKSQVRDFVIALLLGVVVGVWATYYIKGK